MKEIKELVLISKFAGGRFDLVQGSGGNASVKRNDGVMLIKASGFLLSEVEIHKGYTYVNNKKIFEKKTSTYFLQSLRRDMAKGSSRPSIEVFFVLFQDLYSSLN